MKWLLTLLLTLCLLPLSAQFPADLFGTWKGQVIEPGRSDWYPVVINIYQTTEGQVQATVFYPSYGCGGALELQGKTAEGASFTEVITEGVFTCINKGKVILRLSEDHTDQVHYRWSHSQYNHEAIGILERQAL